MADVGSFASFSASAVVGHPVDPAQRIPRRCCASSRTSPGARGAILVGGGTIGVMVLLSRRGRHVARHRGLQRPRARRSRPADRLRLRQRQHPRARPADRRAGAGGPGRLPLHRPDRLDEDPRGDRRARGDGGPPMRYLVTTRVIAAMLAILPLYLIGLIGCYIAVASCRSSSSSTSPAAPTTTTSRPSSRAATSSLSVVKILIFAFAIALIHCWYGFNAAGGPAGRRGGHRPRDPRHRSWSSSCSTWSSPSSSGARPRVPDLGVGDRWGSSGRARRPDQHELATRGLMLLGVFGVAARR